MAEAERKLGPDDETNVMRGAFRVRMHVGTLDRALRHGELPYRWEDGRRIIKIRDLDAWADRRRRRPSIASPAAEAAAS